MMTTYSSTYRSPGASYQPTNPGDEYSPRGNSVQNYSCKEESNHRYRPYMEDGHKIIDSYLGDPNQGFFAIYDGHGGSEAVDYCKNRLHEELRKALHEFSDDVSMAFSRCFKKVDDQLRLAGAATSGSTATIALIRKESHQRVLYVANVGDSKAVLVKSSGFEQLSYDHKGTDASEIDRIVSSGGYLIRGRVAGQLAVTRALGDHHLKTSGVSSEPYVSRRVITPNEQFLVLASDGLWDVVNERELEGLKGRNSMEIGNRLMERAINGGSQDNICILTICF
ncbi:unnamed protein product [Blepharisma stoltei]|uniref:PPM-type phosphatase domain-containing protein n=1 Tax=Blepharisma stoltei TaxID=1481888 RepID=A0AAU9K1T0_9CILI|nr:unnamed protein product [Blepharisma stoltei]